MTLFTKIDSSFRYFTEMRVSLLLALCVDLRLSSSINVPLQALTLITNSTLAESWQSNITNTQTVTRPPPEGWPQVPWTQDGLINDGKLEIEFHGRYLVNTPTTKEKIADGMADLYPEIRSVFDFAERDMWMFNTGVVRFELSLEPYHYPSRTEIRNLYWWLYRLVAEHKDAPAEIGSAILFVRGAVRANIALKFPGIVI